MFVRDTTAMYRQSVLGYVWLLLPPLATSFIWIFLSSQDLVSLETGGPSVALFVMTGTVLWGAFNASVTGMLSVKSEARCLLAKYNFTHEALIYSAVCKVILNSFVPALMLLPAMLILSVPIRGSILLFPIGFLTLTCLGSALGLIVSPIASMYTDVGRAAQLALRFGFFVTPVIFTLPPSGLTRTLLLCNPAAAPLVTCRNCLIGGDDVLWPATIAILICSCLLMLAATLIFKITIPNIIERFSA